MPIVEDDKNPLGTEEVGEHIFKNDIVEPSVTSVPTQPTETQEESVSDNSKNTFMYVDDIIEYNGESSTVEQEEPILVEPTKKNPISDFRESVPLPVAPSSVLLKYSENFPNLNIDDSDEGREWLDSFHRSSFVTPLKDQFVSRLKKKGSQFKQSVDYEGQKLRAGIIKLGANPGDKLTGEQAVYWVKSVTGQGGIIQIPLWHSGFWISIKTPSEIALLELNARIAEDKVQFGRNTYGLAFSNSTVFFANHLVNFVLDHLFDHSIKDVKDIRPYIVSHDLHQLVWGMACAVWKNGFQYSRSIIKEDGSIGETFKALLAVPKMCLTDNSALTEWQKSHMAGRHGKNMTVESVEKYRREFTVGHSRMIELDQDDEISMELSVPMIDKYLESGQKWVNFLIARVETAMQITSDDGRRQEYVVNYGKASLLRQYAHWVKSITVKGRKFEDVDTVETLLDDFSARESIRDIYFNEIGKFIDDTTVSIIGVPAIKKIDDQNKIKRFPFIVPIDPLMVFFILLVQKVELISVR